MADAKQAAVSRRKFLSTVADTHTLILPIHFPITDSRFGHGRRGSIRLPVQTRLSCRCCKVTSYRMSALDGRHHRIPTNQSADFSDGPLRLVQFD
jgi:hypothetical protein